MDEMVRKALAKWPDVPDVYGWLSLDRRGNWLLRGERIGNAAMRAYIARNYAPDARGRWFFQNGPQRVFVRLSYAPLVLHLEGTELRDQCGNRFVAESALLDDEGSMLLAGGGGVGLLDDRDLARYLEQLGPAAERLPRIARDAVPARFGFVRDPAPEPGKY